MVAGVGGGLSCVLPLALLPLVALDLRYTRWMRDGFNGMSTSVHAPTNHKRFAPLPACLVAWCAAVCGRGFRSRSTISACLQLDQCNKLRLGQVSFLGLSKVFLWFFERF